MRKLSVLICAPLAFATIAVPASAQQSESLQYFSRAHDQAVPELWSEEDKAYYQSLFAALEAENWSRAEVNWVDARLKFKGRIDRDDWIGQAQALAAEKDG